MSVHCPTCQRRTEIVGFKRDDPLLACGHTKQRVTADDKRIEVSQAIDAAIIRRAVATGQPVEKVRTDFINNFLVLLQKSTI